MARVALALPDASPDGLEMARRGFESYLFAVGLWGPGFVVAMPSRGVDEVWHQAILHSRFYARICQERAGFFVHHDPGPIGKALLTPSQAADELGALARAWVGACRFEGLSPADPLSLPALFACDRLLGLAEGFRYSTDEAGSTVPLERLARRAAELPEPEGRGVGASKKKGPLGRP